MKISTLCLLCGKQIETTAKRVADGRGKYCSKHCGNSATGRKHGHNNRSHSPTYTSWVAMKQRCLNPNHTKYPRYGGAGVTVCDRWHDFAPFLADMGERPDGMTLDRIDGHKGYAPDNCRWADIATQSRNKKAIQMIADGEDTVTLHEFALKHGLSKATVEYRYKQGWPVEAMRAKPSGRPLSFR